MPPDAPLATIVRQRGALNLAATDARAQALGLAPGLTFADARARVPELIAFDADDAADRRLLERLADACARLTPRLMIDEPDGLLLDISGCAQLFGGEAALCAEVEAMVHGHDLSLFHACASTGAAARALAQTRLGTQQDEAAAVARLPVAVLRLDAEVLHGLRRAGLKRVGQLTGLAHATLAARFGTQTVRALAQLTGDATVAQQPRRLRASIRAEHRCAEPFLLVEQLYAILHDLALVCMRQLEHRQLGGRRFVARIVRTDGDSVRLAVETSLPTRDAALLLRLLSERIDGLRDPIDPGFGFDLVQLRVVRTEPLSPVQRALDASAIHNETVSALIDRLATRLGHDRVFGLAAQGSHIPERAQRATAPLEAADQGFAEYALVGGGQVRPLLLFDPPQPVDVVAEVPDGPPRRFHWRGRVHSVARAEGPERIAAEWWRSKSNRGRTRDYFRVEDSEGVRHWMFRHGLYTESTTPPRWYIHGLLA